MNRIIQAKELPADLPAVGAKLRRGALLGMKALLVDTAGRVACADEAESRHDSLRRSLHPASILSWPGRVRAARTTTQGNPCGPFPELETAGTICALQEKVARAHPYSGASQKADEVVERRKRLHQLSLVLHPDPMLRSVCPPVDAFDSTLRDLLQEMFEFLASHQAIGLAGPQIAVPQRLLVCQIGGRPLCLMNPEIQAAAAPALMTEGCLSLPDVRTTIARPERIQVQGYDERGRRRRYSATGLWARVIQHELDHLNGTLIVDYGPPSVESSFLGEPAPPASLVEEPRNGHAASPRA